MTVQPSGNRDALAAMGRMLGPDVLSGVYALYRGEQEAFAALQPIAVENIAYGDDPRHRLDLYLPDARTEGAPILLWVHGGGFLRGDKQAEGLFNAHVGRWAAREGMVGAVMNYRLAPEHEWPAGGEDVIRAVAWLRANADTFGGDPDRTILAGTSAGATHVATALRLGIAPDGLCGAILLSGLYGFTPLDKRDTLYYGPASAYPDRSPREAMIETSLPLFLACAEFDPPRFQAEAIGLAAARLDRHGALPAFGVVAGHNHFSLAYHLGGRDSRLSEAMTAFIAGVTPSSAGETAS